MAAEDGKERSLREHRSLNRNPDRVSDPLFLEDDFFDPRDLVQVRYEMLRRVQKEGRPIAEAADRFGVTRQTWHRLANVFRAGGAPALADARPGPRRASKLGPEVVEALIEARRDAAGITAGELARLVRDRFGLTVNPRTVERALKRAAKKR